MNTIIAKCKELIAEAETDLDEYGNIEVAIWYLMIDGIPIVTNYDFIEDECPIQFGDLKKGEAITKGNLEDLLAILEKQNEGYAKR